jgi:hypothetical protein
VAEEPRTFPDDAWDEIRAIAKRHRPPLTPDAEARAKLSTVLFDWYPAFAYDRERAEAVLDLSERMLGHIDTFAQLYRQTWLPHLAVEDFQRLLTIPASLFPDNVRANAHLWGMRHLHNYVLANVLYYRAIKRAHARNASVQREMLYHWLCSVWLENFGAPGLTQSRSRGGEPGGPLIAFMLAAMKPILPHYALPSRETLRDAIKRERRERENVAQLRFHFERR